MFMRSILEAFYFGRLSPWERGRPKDPDYTPTSRKISDITEYFQEKLQPDDFLKLEELGNLRSRCSLIEEVDAFTYGLCMGMLLMMEVFDFKQQLLTEAE